jgi:hypothetical protein
MELRFYDKTLHQCKLCGCLLPDKSEDIIGHTCHPEALLNRVTAPYQVPLKKEEVMDEKQVAVRDVMPTFVATLPEMEKRYKELQEFVQKQMVEDEDYGKIPGCPKPSLFKPGAEKLLEIYGYAVSDIVIEDKIEDWEKGFIHYDIKATAVSKRTGQIVGVGVGSCNSKEKKYINQESFSLVNTLMKMAKKRAIVDLALLVTRSSAIFTQDIEDIDGNGNGHDEPTTPKLSDDEEKKQFEIAAWCLQMADNSKDKAKSILITLTGFKGKDGKQVPGVDNPNKLTGKRLEVCHKIIGKEFESWQKILEQ